MPRTKIELSAVATPVEAGDQSVAIAVTEAVPVSAHLVSEVPTAAVDFGEGAESNSSTVVPRTTSRTVPAPSEHGITENEMELFDYRATCKCFTYFDFGMLLIQLIIFKGWQLGLVLLGFFGPACGFRGCNALEVWPTAGYLFVCAAKAAVYTTMAIVEATDETEGSVFLQGCYAAIQVAIFFAVLRYLGMLLKVDKDRLEDLRDPAFLRQAMAATEMLALAREREEDDEEAQGVQAR